MYVNRVYSFINISTWIEKLPSLDVWLNCTSLCDFHSLLEKANTLEVAAVINAKAPLDAAGNPLTFKDDAWEPAMDAIVVEVTTGPREVCKWAFHYNHQIVLHLLEFNKMIIVLSTPVDPLTNSETTTGNLRSVCFPSGKSTAAKKLELTFTVNVPGSLVCTGKNHAPSLETNSNNSTITNNSLKR